MEPVPSSIIVGIDVSKRTLAIATSASARPATQPNGSAGFAALITALPAPADVLIVLEATGEYHIPLVTALDAAGYACAICNPAHVRAFAKSCGLRSKTDRTDATLLVRFGLARSPRPQPLLPPVLQHLRALLARRADLLGMRTMERNRCQATHDAVVKESLLRTIALLTEESDALLGQITAMIAADPALAARSAQLQTVPGIGPVVAAQLLAGLTELGARTASELAALVGVAPFARESGQFRGKRFIGGGRATVRQALYQAVNTAVGGRCRANPLKTHYHQLRARQKPRNLAIVAEMRRLLRYLTRMVRDNLTWTDLTVNQPPIPA